MLRHHHARLSLLAPLVVAGLVVAACHAKEERRESSTSVTSGEMPGPPATRATAGTAALPIPAEAPLACATLRDVGVSDVVRLDGTTLFYADATAGLTVVDVADAANPRVLSVVPFVGTPLALFVREGVAWVVFVDPDSRSGKAGLATVVRAVDVRNPASPRIIGDQVRSGTARDAKLVGGLLYLMHGAKGHTVVESFGVEGTALQPLDAVGIDGAPAQLAANAAGLAAVTTSDDHATVAWLDLSMERRGSILLRQSVRLPGGVATWERGEGKIVDADEGQRVRVVTCATRSCTPSDAATLRIVDFGTDAPARTMTSLRLTEHDGRPTTRFADGLLYVAETPVPGKESTTLHVVGTDGRVPRFVAHHPLRGRISALVPREGSLVALGSVGSTDTQMKMIVHDLDVRKPAAPRTRTSVTFGSDWTWSIVADDEGAMSFDPASHLVAVPFTAWRHADKRYVTGAQLVDVRPYGGQAAAALPVDGWVERAVFLDGHLVTLGPNGISSIDYASTHQPDLTERPLEIGR
jgi:hypothetical protein